MIYLFTNVIGSFILDENLRIVDSLPFKTISDYRHKSKFEQKLNKKYHPSLLPEEKWPKVLSLFRPEHFFSIFYQQNLFLTKEALKNSVKEDQFIIQAVSNILELDHTANILVKRLREWYSLYFPELVKKITDHETFTEILLKGKIIKQESMGADLEKVHLDEIKLLAQQIIQLYQLRKEHEKYLQKVMSKYCPNLLELAGITLGAKLIELGKGLKHLALLPASTIQLLGAEKALFRHLKTGARSPKHGIIINHPLVQKAKRQEKGKMARMLADKLSLCARLDYFKGEFKAKDYFQELEGKLS